MSKDLIAIAENKKVYRSCIMVEEQKYLDDFLKLGVKAVFTNKDGVIIVDIPLESIDEFVEMYLKVMKSGRWNEYVGPKTGFYFKMPDGTTKHILLNEESKETINATIKEFIPNWDIKNDLWVWLSTLDIYKEFLL